MASPILRPNPYDVPISGAVELWEGKRAKTWYARWRDADGQHRRKLGPAWTKTGPPDPGFFREREANAALQAILTDARRGAVEQRRTGITFAEAADDWYEHGLLERDWSSSTKADYRSALNKYLIPTFGTLPIEKISPARIERWRNQLVRGGDVQRRNANRLLAIMHAAFVHAKKHHGLVENPA
ncbi:MAG: tyrosine-type recombinase/integrase, partial [Solirubrobacteraceae bacterium]